MTKTFHVLGNVDNLLKILILSVIEDRIVDDYAINGLVRIGSNQGLFNLVFVDFAECVQKATVESQVVSCTVLLLPRRLTASERAANSYFSLHVFSVQSAYNRAAGSALARTPSKWGGRSSLFKPSETSASNPLAMLPASTTLQDAGVD